MPLLYSYCLGFEELWGEEDGLEDGGDWGGGLDWVLGWGCWGLGGGELGGGQGGWLDELLSEQCDYLLLQIQRDRPRLQTLSHNNR